MRKGTEGKVDSLGQLFGRQVFAVQIEPPGLRRVDRLDVRRTFLPAGKRRNFRLRMTHQQANQFTGGVTGGSQNSNFNHCS